MPSARRKTENTFLGWDGPVGPRWTGTVLGVGLLAAATLLSHPMGNFSISHYARLTFGAENVNLLYLIDMAEIPAFQEKPLVDQNGNGVIEANEQDTYLSKKTSTLTEGLVVSLNGTRCSLTPVSQQVEFLPGGLNLPTLKIALNYRLSLKAADLKDINTLEYEDKNFPGHAGWKEIVVEGNGIEESFPSGVDRSQQLTRYPEDPAIRPPEDLAARIRFRRTAGDENSQRSPSAGITSVGLVWVALLVLCGSGGFLLWRRLSESRRP